MLNFKSFILSLWFLVLLHPLVAQDNNEDKDKPKEKQKKPNSVAELKLLNPTRTEHSPILVAIGSTIEFKWEWVRKPEKPVEGFTLVLVRNVPTEVVYPIAANLSASTFSYSWNTEEYNNDPDTQNQLIADNYMFYIYNSNYTKTYKHAPKFGELQPYATKWSFFNSKEPSTKFKFDNGSKTNSFSLFLVNTLILLYLIN